MNSPRPYQVAGVPLPFAVDRFDEVCTTVHEGGAIDGQTRQDIGQLLEFLWILVMRDQAQHRTGAPRDLAQWQRAETIRILQARHGCTIDEAIHAVEPHGTAKVSQALTRMVARLNKNQHVTQERIAVDPRFLAFAERNLAGHK
jgi:hypothetical protein